MTPIIETFTGLRVNPLFVKETDIVIEDIAHSLALINRFCGHTQRPNSVAQHSVYVSRLCDLHEVNCTFGGLSRGTCSCGASKVALQALLHDASEAYLGDVTKWLKASPEFAAYRRVEATTQRTIYRRFGCAEIQHPLVNIADTLMVRFEAYKNSPTHAMFDLPDYPPPTIKEMARVGPWAPWTWRQSEELFLQQFRELLGSNVSAI
jgi:5'-deoxynucleotidase YfbR-like HD superfamily hydrolase